MTDKLKKAIAIATEKQGITNSIINLEHPEDNAFGDFSSNVALVYSKQLKVAPKVLAEKIIEELKKENIEEVSSVELAGPGFINIKIKDAYFVKGIADLAKQGETVGKITKDAGRKVMVEYTAPNSSSRSRLNAICATAARWSD